MLHSFWKKFLFFDFSKQKTFPKILWISKLFRPLFGQLNEKYLPLVTIIVCFSKIFPKISCLVFMLQYVWAKLTSFIYIKGVNFAQTYCILEKPYVCLYKFLFCKSILGAGCEQFMTIIMYLESWIVHSPLRGWTKKRWRLNKKLSELASLETHLVKLGLGL